MSTPGLKVFAPASVANLAVGFDILGLALEAPGDEIIVRFKPEPGLAITKITGGKLPLDVEKNTAGVAALRLLEHLGEQERGIEMEIHKKMPFGSGLGSSSASAAGAVVAVNELLKRPLERRELLKFAVMGEQAADGAWHADNVAPALLGGILLIRDNATLDFHRLPVPRGLYVSVVYPHVQVLTREARAILSTQLSLASHIQQNGNLGGLIIGLYTSDFELIRRSLKDNIIEPQRAGLIPHFHEVQSAALTCGALGCSISGAGPSIFALSANSLIAEEAGKAMHQVFAKNKIDCDLFISPINQEGVKLQ
jgi:homoserine kinase